MKQIPIDISNCQTVDDFYLALLSELGAPGWHGRNLDALWDSITSDINDVMPPYSIEVSGRDCVPNEVATMLSRVQTIFEEARTVEQIEISFKFS